VLWGNVLLEAFTRAYSKGAKNTVKPSAFFALLGSVCVTLLIKLAACIFDDWRLRYVATHI
jgi:hypothetical protein